MSSTVLWEMFYQNLSNLRMYKSTSQIRLMRQLNVMQTILKLGPLLHTSRKTSMIRTQALSPMQLRMVVVLDFFFGRLKSSKATTQSKYLPDFFENKRIQKNILCQHGLQPTLWSSVLTAMSQKVQKWRSSASTSSFFHWLVNLAQKLTQNVSTYVCGTDRKTL